MDKKHFEEFCQSIGDLNPARKTAAWMAWQAATILERESCAKECEKTKTVAPFELDDVERGFNAGLKRAAIVIRNRP